MGRIETEVAVVGAGPAGIAAAKGVSDAGFQVTLIDPGRDASPRIESLPVNGWALAERLGFRKALASACLGNAGTMNMQWRDYPEHQDFDDAAPLLIERCRLHRALRAMAPRARTMVARADEIRSLGNAVLVRVGPDTIVAQFVIDARGRSALRARAPQGMASVPLVALAFTAWLPPGPRRPSMHIEALCGGWKWACFLPDGRLSGAMFLAGTTLSGLDARGRQAMLEKQLASSSLGLPDQLVMGRAAPAMLRLADDPFPDPRILRIGDAALARDPIASHGLVHAFRSGAQAAAAVATLLDPAEDDAAARSFIRDRHRRAADAAIKSTARAYREQTRHRSAFWSVAAQAAFATTLPTPEKGRWPALSRPLGLALPLSRVAVLEADRIRWSRAIWLCQSQEAAPRIGPVTATRLAEILGSPAPVATLSARLEADVGAACAQRILRMLLDERALVEIRGQAGVARFSKL
jgi:2-polyprenyl-6-methoxyphenol hydroxylase-like FAD-dependent oxidoreductase